MITKGEWNVDGDFIMLVEGCANCPLCHEYHEQGFNSYVCEALGEHTSVRGQKSDYILSGCPVAKDRVLIYRKKNK